MNEYQSERVNLSFFERQHIDCMEREKKRKRREEENSAKTLRKMMQPRLNQSNNESLERQSAELGRGLYEAGKKSVQQIAMRRDAFEKTLQSQMNSQKALATSKKLIEDRTDLKVTEIFDLLDSDGDGVISAKRIAIEALEADHCRILGPYLLQLEEVPNSSMDLEQFKTLMQYAFRVPRDLPENQYRREAHHPRDERKEAAATATQLPGTRCSAATNMPQKQAARRAQAKNIRARPPQTGAQVRSASEGRLSELRVRLQAEDQPVPSSRLCLL